MYSQNKDTLLANNILQIREIIFVHQGEGNLPSPRTTKLLPEATKSESAVIKTPTVQTRQEQRQDSSSVSPQVMQYSKNLDTYLRPYLEYKVKNFRGGQISTHLTQWEALTSENTILQTVVGDTIEFIEQPPEMSNIPKNSIAKEHAEQVYTELNNLIEKKVIVPCDHEPGEFISPIFSVPKKDNKIRFILNLKHLNQYVQYHHFKGHVSCT